MYLQDQWKKKKQTKEEAKAAKRNKLDPDSELNKNAKEVMDERARNKRKLRDMQESPEADSGEEQDDISLDLDVEKEKPGEGLKKVAPAETEPGETASKKPKLAEDDEPQEALSEKAKAKAEKKLAKQKKKEEKELKKAKKDAKSDQTAAEKPIEDAAEEDQPAPEKKDKQRSSKKTKDAVLIHESTESDPTPEADAEMEQISVPGLVDEEEEASTSASTPHSPVFDTAPGTTSNPSSVEAASTTTSLASAVAPSEKPKHIKIPTDTTALRARLAARIEALRAARKADGSDGKPILTRSELIEERRRKQAQRKAHKKELRLKAKQEEDLKREEALASARNSPGGGLMSPMIPSSVADEVETSFSFGRVAFADGTTLSRDLTYEKEAGPSKKKLDPKSALAKVEAQKRRLEGLDDDKRRDVLEKETWLAARRKAEGERVRDDEALLKKAVKRKDKAKQKSEKEWKERKAGVAKGIHDRQKKREANLQARRDGKGQKGKKKSGPTKKKAARPGFEGSFSVGGGKKR